MYPSLFCTRIIYCFSSRPHSSTTLPERKQGVLYFIVQFCESYGIRLFYNRRTRTLKGDYTNNQNTNQKQNLFHKLFTFLT